jgi:FkbM family methyltransferase
MISKILQNAVSRVSWRFRVIIKHVPLVAPLQRWLIANFLEGKEFVHRVDAGPARGLVYPVRLPQDKGVWTGTYESEFAAALANAVTPGSACLDIGGWHGFYSGVMALAGASKVIVFEPLPANCARIRRLIELNPQLSIELIEAAVSEISGELEFQVMPETSMGKLACSAFQPEQTGAKRITVNAVTIDDLVTTMKIERPNVIKIDVEGAELLALRGAERTLADSRPKIFMEAHSLELLRSCTSFLETRGFATRVLEAEGQSSVISQVYHLAAWVPNTV